jgi:hypothetical protein
MWSGSATLQAPSSRAQHRERRASFDGRPPTDAPGCIFLPRSRSDSDSDREAAGGSNALRRVPACERSHIEPRRERSHASISFDERLRLAPHLVRRSCRRRRSSTIPSSASGRLRAAPAPRKLAHEWHTEPESAWHFAQPCAPQRQEQSLVMMGSGVRVPASAWPVGKSL